MIVAIMQPYFFPYIGYFQLMHAVDTFVLYDDAQYADQRWMNRNRIRHGTRSVWLTLPVKRKRLGRCIHEREYRLLDSDVDVAKRKLQAAYRTAPYRSEAFPLVDGLLDFPNPNIANFNANLLEVIATSLGIQCDVVSSSSLPSADGSRGVARVLELCSRLSATQYVNAIGGTDLYDEAVFADTGLGLRFLRTRVPPVPLADGPEHLSIIDGLMHGGTEGCAATLPDYELLSPTAARDLVQRVPA